MLIYSKLFHTNLSYNDTICIYTLYRMYTKNYYPLTYTLNRTLPIHSISSLVQCMLYIYTLIIIHDIYIYTLSQTISTSPYSTYICAYTYVYVHIHIHICNHYIIKLLIIYNFLYPS